MDYMSITQAAKELGVGYHTLYYHVRGRDVPSRRLGTHYYFNPAQLEQARTFYRQREERQKGGQNG